MRLDDEIWSDYWHAKRAAWSGDTAAAEHLYRGLRRNHSIELYYEVELAAPVKFVHPLGTVLGRATYAPHLVVYQNVGVGSDLNGNRPTFKGPCVLFPGAKVLGNTVVGSNVYITANTVVQGVTIPDNCVVFPSMRVFGRDQGNGAGNYVTCDTKSTARSIINDYFTPKRRDGDTPQQAKLG